MKRRKKRSGINNHNNMAGDCGKGGVFVIFFGTYPTPPSSVISLLKVIMSHFCSRCSIFLSFSVGHRNTTVQPSRGLVGLICLTSLCVSRRRDESPERLRETRRVSSCNHGTPVRRSRLVNLFSHTHSLSRSLSPIRKLTWVGTNDIPSYLIPSYPIPAIVAIQKDNGSNTPCHPSIPVPFVFPPSSPPLLPLSLSLFLDFVYTWL